MGSLSNFSISLSWNTTVIVDEEECIVSLKSYCFLDKKNKSYLNCHNGTMLTKTSNDETTKRNNDPSSSNEERKETDIENDEIASASETPFEMSTTFLRCLGITQKEIDIRMCTKKMRYGRMPWTLPDSCTKPGILVLTHFVAAAIGAGILYCALFMKKIKRTLNDKNKEEGNKGISNASYNIQKGSAEGMSAPCFSHQDEGVYCEVADKPRSLPSQTNFSYSLAVDSALESLKNTGLPDIPQQTKKTNDLYLTPISRSLPHEYLGSSGKVITESSAMDEKERRWTNDSKSEINVMNEADRLKDTFDTESSEQYFVLEKGSDMDLK
ncbi:uncharacterized protein LOC133187840 [Saccostrea echinata]|uniref:uncharacterized protein LOC133187840 n=1 Tax=Saccostrea echinata TaxID=191078 RepID=UPI002A7EB5AD|nr:uncharacterized protein LOC133187840 [Saccostrea echinata]